MSKKLLVCDLDNTLYDWVGYFVPAFYAMIDEVVRITNCDRERLLDDFRDVHRKYHDSEHPFSLLETRTIEELFQGQSRREVAEQLDPAFHAFNSNRKQNLQVYPSVHYSLERLSNASLIIVAHTESKLYAVIDRLRRLNLTKYFRRIYCRERPNSEHPNPEAVARWLEKFPLQKVVELSHHQRKPDPNVLLEICRSEDISPEESAYVGDSMARDILMAKTAGVCAIWAKYGALHREEQYRKLVRISHWTDEDIDRERKLKKRARGVRPDHILEKSFAEILDIFFDDQMRECVIKHSR